MTFFRRAHHLGGDRYVPLPDASSRWTGSQLRGPAITALLAGGLERALPAEAGWRPVRATFELHSPVPMDPCWVEARTLKQGRTLTLVDAELFSEASERPLARCRASFVSPAVGDDAQPPDTVWATPAPEECAPPSEELREISSAGRLYRSSSTQWSGTRAGHQNAERKLVWFYDEPVIEGETPSPFQYAARAADLGNYVINAGAEGISYINSDVTVHLSRLPTPGGVGLCSELRSADTGVSVGTAILFDSAGVCGTSTVTSVRHSKTRLSYGQMEDGPGTP